MIKLNKETYLDKLHACWLGKSIGGTIGAPYEGSHEYMDVTGFRSKSGEPLPNDDLDLQLVWLLAMERTGPDRLDTNVLADYWLEWIPPYWNEYGTCKTNLRLGLCPPMSGEVDNERWKTSNGAWIRSEIWAGLAPGVTDVAIRYAVQDGMVDHGLAEGTHAEVFTAVLQSLAYVENDIRKLLKAALSKIPENSRVAKTVRLVMDCYDKGMDRKEVRELILKENEDLGWFQAPNNLGFVTLGLLYGEGDFKKSVLYAVNCGDDTDCTAGTVGSTLGIILGTAGIPEDWKQFVGDRILTISVAGMHVHRLPKNCTELTERVAKLVPKVMEANGVALALTDGETDYPEEDRIRYNSAAVETYFSFSPYSYNVTHYRGFDCRVELDDTPRMRPGDTRHVKLSLHADQRMRESHKFVLRLLLPEGWKAGYYPKTLHLLYPQAIHNLFGDASVEFDITAGETVEAVNRAYMEFTSPDLCYSMMIPIIFIG
ncbi:MAG: ADP-ribosylglycohydrolase family protein [Lachnospiraceae bacterium]|nr:ADP-ribosylglycohydrolase family protein [Lachnospiraceae bacterium]